MDVANYSPSLLSASKLNSSGHNTEITQAENRKLLLRILRKNGETSRKELSEQSGLKQATVTIIINDFIKRGLVEEIGLIEGSSRKVRGIRLVNRFCIVAVRLSVSYISVALYDMEGVNLYCHKIFMETLSDPEHCCNVLAHEIKTAAAACVNPKMEILGVGMGVEGSFVIKDQRYQYYDTEKKCYFDFASNISGRVDYPVFINRMSNYAAYQVWKKYWTKPLGTIVSFTLSYTFECGIIVNGEMLNGSQGLAGRIGQVICGTDSEGKPVRFQDVASVGSIIERVKEALPDHPESLLSNIRGEINIRDIINAYKENDPVAVKVYDDCAVYCGRAINYIINLLNPDMIFFGDEVPLTDEYFEKVYKEAVSGIYTFFDDMEFREKSDGTGYRVKIPEADVSLKLLKPDKVRNTMNDPSLLGAMEYVIEVSIENGVLFEQQEDVYSV